LHKNNVTKQKRDGRKETFGWFLKAELIVISITENVQVFFSANTGVFVY
jgi:hypothetical protein